MKIMRTLKDKNSDFQVYFITHILLFFAEKFMNALMTNASSWTLIFRHLIQTKSQIITNEGIFFNEKVKTLFFLMDHNIFFWKAIVELFNSRGNRLLQKIFPENYERLSNKIS